MMSDEERERRKEAHRVVERQMPETFVWLSFADPSRPDGHLGVAIVKARGPITAMDRAWALGINPGGSMQPHNLGPDEDALRAEYGADFDRLFEKLMPPDEVRAMMATKH